jgi:hypothetical protein
MKERNGRGAITTMLVPCYFCVNGLVMSLCTGVNRPGTWISCTKKKKGIFYSNAGQHGFLLGRFTVFNRYSFHRQNHKHYEIPDGFCTAS